MMPIIAPYVSADKLKSLGDSLKQTLAPVVNSAKDVAAKVKDSVSHAAEYVSRKSSNLIGRS